MKDTYYYFNNQSKLKINVVDYTPTLDDEDVDNLVEFCVELFCVKNTSEVNSD